MGTKKTVLVTGSEGFIGKALVKKLKAKNFNVVKFSHSLGDDITKKDAFAKIGKVDVIIHLAALTYVPSSWEDPAKFIEVNTKGTLNALEFARKSENKPKFILASAFVYGNPKHIPIKENDPISPNNPYAVSKHLAEQLSQFYSQNYQIPALALRCFNIYGPGQPKTFLIARIVDGIKSGIVKLEDPRPKRDFVYVNDVVNAYIKAINYKGEYKIINIASGKSYSVSDIADLAKAFSKKEFVVQFSNKRRKNEIMDSRADISLAKKYLKWLPKTTFEKGLQITLKQSLL